jgi:hypothetical protein
MPAASLLANASRSTTSDTCTHTHQERPLAPSTDIKGIGWALSALIAHSAPGTIILKAERALSPPPLDPSQARSGLWQSRFPPPLPPRTHHVDVSLGGGHHECRSPAAVLLPGVRPKVQQRPGCHTTPKPTKVKAGYRLTYSSLFTTTYSLLCHPYGYQSNDLSVWSPDGVCVSGGGGGGEGGGLLGPPRHVKPRTPLQQHQQHLEEPHHHTQGQLQVRAVARAKHRWQMTGCKRKSK